MHVVTFALQVSRRRLDAPRPNHWDRTPAEWGMSGGKALEECATAEWWVIGQGGEWSDARHPEMMLHHWQKRNGSCWSRRNRGLGWSACWLVSVAPSIACIVASTARLSRSSESNATILKHRSTVMAKHSSPSPKTSPNLKDYSVNYPRYKLWIVATLNPQLLNSVRMWVEFKG